MYRFTGRTLIEIGVELWQQQSRLGFFRTRDIDERAVFIETQTLALTPGTVIDADFLINENTALWYPMEVMVIRCVNDGIVVKFLSETAGLFRALEKYSMIHTSANRLIRTADTTASSFNQGPYSDFGEQRRVNSAWKPGRKW